MDYIYLLGSIASIISLGYICWTIIKKRQISFFNLYVLVIVLFQVILIGWGLWTGNKVSVVINAGILFFILCCWFLYYILNRQQEMLNSVVENLKYHSKFLDIHNKDIKNLYEAIKYILQHMKEFGEVSRETIDFFEEVVTSLESKIDINNQQLNDNLTNLQNLQKKKGQKKSK